MKKLSIGFVLLAAVWGGAAAEQGGAPVGRHGRRLGH